MELLKNTRLKIGNYILARKAKRSTRQVIYSKIELVKSIGIVWDATNSDQFLSLSRFHQKMQERKIDIRILGYFPGKELPDRYTALRYLTCIRRKEVGAFFNPVSSESESFITQTFDILIDVNFKKVFPLYYITSLSNARFKVGLLTSDAPDTPFDLMMDIKSPVDIDDYLNQVIKYLEMINSGTVNPLINK